LDKPGISKKPNTSLPDGTIREYSSLKRRRKIVYCISILSPPYLRRGVMPEGS